MIKLRPWQSAALNKAREWLIDKGHDRHFLINAAPGAGKTMASCAIAADLLRLEKIDRVIVIAPRAEVVNQWADDFKRVTDRHMGKVTAADGDVSNLNIDICATWSAVQGLMPELQALCKNSNVLLICDEHHHAAVEAAWGDSTNSAFEQAKYVLILTGTPIRSDGEKSVWLAYDDYGAISHPEGGTYTLTYGEAVDLGYCRPITFHRHEGKFTVSLDDDEEVQISGHSPAELKAEYKRIPGLQTALDFYKLARTPLYEKDDKTPLQNGYQSTMLQYGCSKLDELRLRMPEAGGLVIAPTIEMAEYMANILENLEGERPIIVHSNLPNPDAKIKAYKNTNTKWLVSVAMISEGVDIKRLRVLVYLPKALTELAFRQAVGRVVRTLGHSDDTRAYVVMPSFDTFDAYARKVEDEMSPAVKSGNDKPKTKKCPKCESECDLNASECPTCGYEFPERFAPTKQCSKCGAINPMGATTCHSCGESFGHNFNLSLDEALRIGAIVRGMDIDEEEVQLAEEIAPELRKNILKSGDENLVKLLKALPDESYARLTSIINNSKS